MENENYWNKYWDKVTEYTTIDWLRRRKLLSVRTSNVLTRGARHERKNSCNWEYHPISTVKELLEVDECELTLYRNMGKKSLSEIEEFKQKFLKKVEKDFLEKVAKGNVEILHNTNDLISVSAFKEYLNKCKEIAQSFVDKVTTLIESDKCGFKELQAYKYFTELIRLYEYEIPCLIESFLKENKDGNQET